MMNEHDNQPDQTQPEQVQETVEEKKLPDKDELEQTNEIVDSIETEESDKEIISETMSSLTDELKKKLVEAEKQAAVNQDKYQRTFAEFDNFRKRTDKEKILLYEQGAKAVLEKLLPIMDDFERALDHLASSDKEALEKGYQMIYKKFADTLTQVGVTEIKAEGEVFDPELHHAVSHEENEDYGENIVADVFQKGYHYNDTVLRHSMVKVVN